MLKYLLFIARLTLLLLLVIPLQGCMEVIGGTYLILPEVKTWRDSPKPADASPGLEIDYSGHLLAISVARDHSKMLTFQRVTLLTDSGREIVLVPTSKPLLTLDNLSARFHTQDDAGDSFVVRVVVCRDGREEDYTGKVKADVHFKITNRWEEFSQAVDPR